MLIWPILIPSCIYTPSTRPIYEILQTFFLETTKLYIMDKKHVYIRINYTTKVRYDNFKFKKKVIDTIDLADQLPTLSSNKYIGCFRVLLR